MNKSPILQIVGILISLCLLGFAGLNFYKNFVSNNKGTNENPIVVELKEKTENAIDENITKNSIGGIYVGMKVGDLQKLYKGYEFSSGYGEGGHWMWISNKKEHLLTVMSKDNYQNVWGIGSYSSKYKMHNGLAVGDDISKYLKIYPNNQHLYIDPMGDDSYFMPYDMQATELGLVFYVRIEVNNFQELSELELSDHDYYDIEDKGIRGKISCIEMYTWGSELIRTPSNN